eukprot:205981-Pyramimonas_sp.AAC.1
MVRRTEGTPQRGLPRPQWGRRKMDQKQTTPPHLRLPRELACKSKSGVGFCVVYATAALWAVAQHGEQ